MNNIKFDFRLNFGTAGGGSITLNVPRADDLATVNQINNAMNEITDLISLNRYRYILTYYPENVNDFF